MLEAAVTARLTESHASVGVRDLQYLRWSYRESERMRQSKKDRGGGSWRRRQALGYVPFILVLFYFEVFHIKSLKSRQESCS